MAVTWLKLAYEDDVITKAFMATKGDILYASVGGTPAVLAIGGDNEVLTVATDIPAWEAAAVPAHSLDDHTAAAAAVDFSGEQATDLVLHTVANAAARPDPVVGKPILQSDELAVYVCTVAA